MKAKYSMDDLISRSALLERLAFKRMGSMQRNTYPGLESAIAQVKKAPAVDAVEVVRCKGCKHYEVGMCLKIYSDGAVSQYAWQEREPNDFCSKGKRRDDDAD